MRNENEHPPTAWGHLQPRTMGDPCPICGGVDYYCAHMVDRVLSKESKDFDAVMKALSELYAEFSRSQHKEPGKGEVQYRVACLMDAYNRWLG